MNTASLRSFVCLYLVPGLGATNVGNNLSFSATNISNRVLLSEQQSKNIWIPLYFIHFSEIYLSLGLLKPIAEWMPQWTGLIVSQSGKIRQVPLSDQGYLSSETVCSILLYIK